MQRLLVWRCVLDTLRNSHRVYFPGRRFGSDLQLLMILGAVVASRTEGKPTTAAKLACYLDMAPETMRRNLDTLVKLGLLERNENIYVPSPRVASSDHIISAVAWIKRTAGAL